MNIERAYLPWAQQVRERDQEQSRHLLINPSIPDRIVEFIATYRAHHGVGPSWCDATNELDLRRNDTVGVVLEALKATGHITFTTTKRSMNVTI